MRLTCPNCRHSVNLKPELLNPDGSYFGRCSSCGHRQIKHPKIAEEQIIKPVSPNSSFMTSKVTDEKRSKWIIDIPLKKDDLVWFDGHWRTITEESSWSKHILAVDADESIFQFSKDRLREAVNISLDKALGKSEADIIDDSSREIIKKYEIFLFSYFYRHKRWRLISELNDCGMIKKIFTKLRLLMFPLKKIDEEISAFIMMGYYFLISHISFWLQYVKEISSENTLVVVADMINSLIPIMETNFKAVTTDLPSTSLVMALGWIFALPTLFWVVISRHFMMVKLFVEIKIDAQPKVKMNIIKVIMIALAGYFFYTGINRVTGISFIPAAHHLYGQSLISLLSSIIIVGGGYWALLFGYVLLFTKRTTALGEKLAARHQLKRTEEQKGNV